MTDVLLVVFTAVVAIFTAFIAFFTYLVWVAYERIEWLTGSMESYAARMLQIEAARGVPAAPGAPHVPVEVVWWDPTVKPFLFTGVHAAPANLDRIYLGVPLRYRLYHRRLWQKLGRALSGRDI